MSWRYCLPRVRRRGYGLGNELLPWARAFLAAQVLDAQLLPPAFGLNRRGYWRHFQTPLDDWILHRTLVRSLPRVEFLENDWLQFGGGDVVIALQRFAEAHRLHERSAYVFVTDGLWGGLHHILAARDFIRSTLYGSRFAPRNLLQVQSRLTPTRVRVGMHVRLGDFGQARDASQYRYLVNVALPLDWFRAVARSIRARLGDDVEFLVVTDGSEAQLRPLLDEFPCITTGDIPDSDCSDLLALVQCDLLVCSVSTYSNMAAFLSDAPYLWFEPNLHQHAQGYLSLGDPGLDTEGANAPRLLALAAATRSPPPATRATAIGMDGTVPDAVLDAASTRRYLRQWQNDLVAGGLARASSPHA